MCYNPATTTKMSLGGEGLAWNHFWFPGRLLSSSLGFPFAFVGRPQYSLIKISPSFHRPALSPAQCTAFNDYLGSKAYKELFPGSNNVSPSFRNLITKLLHRSVLAELEKQHIKMIFRTFYTVELKHGTSRHQCMS